VSDFSRKLRELAASGKGTVAALTALSDLSSEDRTVFREVWPTLPVEQRRRIVSNLVTLSEDNIELDFRHVFLESLEDTDAHVRLSAIEGLYEDESRVLLVRLIAMLKGDPDEKVREAVAKALTRFTYLDQCAKLGSQAGPLRDTLIASASNKQEASDVRRRAVEALGNYHDDKEVQDLITESYTRGGKSAESAVFAMGRSMDERWQQVVMDELESSHPAMRYEAARAAGEMTLEDALPFLVRMVDDPDTEVRLAAVWALGQIGGKPATEALAPLLKSKETALREAAKEAINELTFGANPLSPKF
jgi:HEAT repeat protein